MANLDKKILAGQITVDNHDGYVSLSKDLVISGAITSYGSSYGLHPPSDGYVLAWSVANSRYQPVIAPSGFTAGGDLIGTSTSQQVVNVTGTTNTLIGSTNSIHLQVGGVDSAISTASYFQIGSAVTIDFYNGTASPVLSSTSGSMYFQTGASPGVWQNISGSWTKLALNLATVISPTQLTTNQNDYNPTGIDTANIIRMSSNASVDITGMGVVSSLLFKKIYNVGSFNIVLKHQNGGSIAVNRFTIPGGADYTIQPDYSVDIFYDSVSTTWRVA